MKNWAKRHLTRTYASSTETDFGHVVIKEPVCDNGTATVHEVNNSVRVISTCKITLKELDTDEIFYAAVYVKANAYIEFGSDGYDTVIYESRLLQNLKE